jgi:hypothetical protein
MPRRKIPKPPRIRFRVLSAAEAKQILKVRAALRMVSRERLLLATYLRAAAKLTDRQEEWLREMVLGMKRVRYALAGLENSLSWFSPHRARGKDVASELEPVGLADLVEHPEAVLIENMRLRSENLALWRIVDAKARVGFRPIP